MQQDYEKIISICRAGGVQKQACEHKKRRAGESAPFFVRVLRGIGVEPMPPDTGWQPVPL